MRWVVRGPSGSHQVEVEHGGEGFEVLIDGRRQVVDLSCLDAALASLRFVADGRGFSITFQRGPDRRWRIGVGEREFDLEVLTPLQALEAAAERRPHAHDFVDGVGGEEGFHVRPVVADVGLLEGGGVGGEAG